MIEHEIGMIIDAVKVAAEKLRSARTRTQMENAEDELCIETRSLFTRYVDMVLWTGEFDETVRKRVHTAMTMGQTDVHGRRTGAANSIRRRLVEFESFSAEEAKKIDRCWLKPLSLLAALTSHGPTQRRAMASGKVRIPHAQR